MKKQQYIVYDEQSNQLRIYRIKTDEGAATELCTLWRTLTSHMQVEACRIWRGASRFVMACHGMAFHEVSFNFRHLCVYFILHLTSHVIKLLIC